ncbi:hypothetical protein INT47_010762 [Mucor saturninus]|uniref:HMG box domain-containing protein n=1 Tax=Mucor saturninus TaxID=64648 RepID=A0A8H7V5P0_9FUNG|nr:hypothetical protein INT47_010762 [Mucor saturninus]
MDIASIVTDSNSTKKVPRPLNCFMTYRLEKQREILLQCPGTNHRDISKITAKWWKEMSVAEKEPYRLKAFKAKFDHEKMYPNYKFNPKKKTTKTRAYKKRTEEVFTAQEFAQQQKLAVLYHEGMKSSTPPNPTLEYMPTIIENATTVETKEDICCATCYSSAVPSSTCFSNTSSKQAHPESFHPVSSQSVSPSSSPYTVSGYYEDPSHLNYAQLYPPHHYYGSSNRQSLAYPYESSFQPSYANPNHTSVSAPTNNDYYTPETKSTNDVRRHAFNPLIHTTYNETPPPTILSPFYYHQ